MKFWDLPANYPCYQFWPCFPSTMLIHSNCGILAYPNFKNHISPETQQFRVFITHYMILLSIIFFLYLLHLFLLPYFFALAAWDFRMVISMEGGEAMFVSDGAKNKSWGTKEARKPLEAKWNLVCRSLLNYQAIVILLYNIDRPPTWGVVQHLTLESPTHQP